MAALVLPKDYEPAMEAVIVSNEDAINELVSALDSAPPSFSYDDLAGIVAARVKSIATDRVKAIVEMLASLYEVHEAVGVEVDQFIGDVAKAAEISLKESIAKSGTTNLRQRLSRLLAGKSLAFVSNARETQRNFERSFCHAEMLTDIRPVLENGTDPVAAVLTHTLKITYHERNEMRDFYIALTPNDLDTLGDLIDEAQTNSEQLGRILDKAQVVYPRSEEE
jgi:hypothetical protein